MRPSALFRALALAAIVVVVIMRLQLRDAPLDDSEGEFAYMGQLLLQGVLPFKIAANMKLPGTYGAYALAMALFGQTPAGVHAGLLLANVAAIVMMFFLGRRLFGETAAWTAAAGYALLSAGASIYGMRALAEHFVVLAALPGLLLLLRWREAPKLSTLFWSGLLFGLAVLMKQGGIFFALFGMVYISWSRFHEMRGLAPKLRATLAELGVFGFATLLPLILVMALFWQAGVFPKFWFWTVDYARAYGSILTLPEGLQIFAREIRFILKPNEGLWLLGAAGLVLAWARRRRGSPAQQEAVLWVTVLLVFSILAVCPGFYFRHYYFVVMLPAVALLGGAGMAFAEDYLAAGTRTGLFALVLLFTVTPLLMIVGGSHRFQERFGLNPFPVVADYIHAHSTESDTVAVLGSEPEIYFYAHRHSAEDYLFTYALGENQPYARQMQDDLIDSIEKNNPLYIVEVNIPTSWLFVPGLCGKDGAYNPKMTCDMFGGSADDAYAWDYVSYAWPYRADVPMRIFDWSADWIPRHYDVVGVADFESNAKITYVWDTGAASYKPKAANFIRLFRRKPDSAPVEGGGHL